MTRLLSVVLAALLAFQPILAEANMLMMGTGSYNGHGTGGGGGGSVPAATGVPTVSGTNGLGQVLTSSVSGVTWTNCTSPACTFTYQWYSGSSTGATTSAAGTCVSPTPISGATSSTFTVSTSSAALGRCYSVAEVANNGNLASSGQSAQFGPIKGAPTVNALPTVVSSNGTFAGATLTASGATFNNCVAGVSPCAATAYQWYSATATAGVCGTFTAISGQTAATFTPTVAGTCYSVTAGTSNFGGSVTGSQVTFGPTVVATPAAAGVPTISGDGIAGDVLTATDPAWTNCGGGACAFAYQWYSGYGGTSCSGVTTSAISGATSSTYTTVNPGGVGRCYTVTETATNAGGNFTTGQSAIFGPLTAPTGGPPALVVAPSLSASPAIVQNTPNSTAFTVSSNATATTGTWSNCSSCTYGYQWWDLNSGTITPLASTASVPPTISSSAGGIYDIPNGDGRSSLGSDAMIGLVTATNAAGETVAPLPTTYVGVTRAYSGTYGTIVSCGADSTCASPVAVTSSNLQTGMWVKLINVAMGSATKPVYTPFNITYSFDSTQNGPAQAWIAIVPATLTATFTSGSTTVTGVSPTAGLVKGLHVAISGDTTTVPAGTTITAISGTTITMSAAAGASKTVANLSVSNPDNVPVQLTTPALNGDLRALVTWTENINGASGNSTLGMNSAKVGPISSPGVNIALPANTALGTYKLLPTEVPGTPHPAYIGEALTADTSPGQWRSGTWANQPYQYSFQWYYCSTAMNNGVASACNVAPTAGSGVTVNGTALTGETTWGHVITSADLGRFLYVRVTATNTAGSVSQDMPPTAAVVAPPTPALAASTTIAWGVSPLIMGRSEYGALPISGAATDGSELIGWPGVWVGPTSYAYQWYSCSPGSTPPGAGCSIGLGTATTFVFQGVPQSVYHVDSSDLGKQMVFATTGFNASAPAGVTFYSAASNTTSAPLNPPEIPQTDLVTYPPGHDPDNPYTCAQVNTTTVPSPPLHSIYVDSTAASGGTGSTGSPFNTVSAAIAAAVPGDTIYLRGTATYNTAVTTTGTPTANYGAVTLSKSNTDGLGNTLFITITADTGAQPKIIPSFVTGARGWILSNLWLAGSGGGGIGVKGTDIILKNNFVGAYQNITDALTDFNSKLTCTGTSCTWPSFGNYLTSTSAPQHAGVLIRGGSLTDPAMCIALDYNTFKFSNGGPAAAYNSRDVLFEGNDVSWESGDVMDASTIYPVMWHKNFGHDIQIVNDGSLPHNDFIQNQTYNNQAIEGTFGWEIDRNRVMGSTDATMRAINDKAYCAVHSLASTCTVDYIDPYLESVVQWNNGPASDVRITNNLIVDANNIHLTTQVQPMSLHFTLIANNDWLGQGSFGDSSTSTVFMNNAAVQGQCYGGTPVAYTALYLNNVVVPLGTGGAVAAIDSDCPTGAWTQAAVNPFTTTWSPGSANGTINSTVQSPTITFPVNTSGPLFKTGVAGTGIPTHNFTGASSNNPPNVGAF